MGYGEVVGNESVHWRIGTEAKVDNAVSWAHEGHDPIAFEDIGKDHGTPGQFKVTLTFPSAEDALTATGMDVPASDDGTARVVIYVPAVKRKRADVEKPTPAAEVRIDW